MAAKKKIQVESGFSLVEIIIGIAIAGVMSLVFSQMATHSIQMQAIAAHNSELAEVRRIFREQVNCDHTFEDILDCSNATQQRWIRGDTTPTGVGRLLLMTSPEGNYLHEGTGLSDLTPGWRYRAYCDLAGDTLRITGTRRIVSSIFASETTAIKKDPRTLADLSDVEIFGARSQQFLCKGHPSRANSIPSFTVSPTHICNAPSAGGLIPIRVTVSNSGQKAFSLNIVPITPSLRSYYGASGTNSNFPGDGGNCPRILEPGNSCNLVMNLQYNGGTLPVPLVLGTGNSTVGMMTIVVTDSVANCAANQAQKEIRGVTTNIPYLPPGP